VLLQGARSKLSRWIELGVSGPRPVGARVRAASLSQYSSVGRWSTTPAATWCHTMSTPISASANGVRTLFGPSVDFGMRCRAPEVVAAFGGRAGRTRARQPGWPGPDPPARAQRLDRGRRIAAGAASGRNTAPPTSGCALRPRQDVSRTGRSTPTGRQCHSVHRVSRRPPLCFGRLGKRSARAQFPGRRRTSRDVPGPRTPGGLLAPASHFSFIVFRLSWLSRRAARPSPGLGRDGSPPDGAQSLRNRDESPHPRKLSGPSNSSSPPPGLTTAAA